MLDNSEKAVKAGIGYTIGNILIKGIAFLTLPLFSRLLTTDEFGVYNVFISYESFLYVVIGLSIHTSMRSANLEFRGKINEYTSSVSLIYLINLMAFTVVFIFFRKPLTSFLSFDIPIVFSLLLYSFGSALLTLYNDRISLDYAYKSFLKIAIFNSFGNVLISLIAIFTVFSRKKDYGRIFGATVAIFITSIFILYRLYSSERPRIKKEYWKFAIRYSLPIVPHGISQVLLAQVDRIMIRQLIGNAAAGIYSLAANIQLVLTIIINSVINPWNTWFYEKVNNGEIRLVTQKAKEICGLFAIFTIGLMAISPELIFILGGQAYEIGKYVAIPMIYSSFLIFLYDVVVIGEYYTKKTQYIMLMTIIVAILNVITNYIFIVKSGFIAAAYTTLFSYLIYLLLHIIISKKLIGFYIIPIKWLAGYVLLVAASATLNLLMIDYFLLRWLLCFLEIVPILIWLGKKNIALVSKIIKGGKN